MHHHGLARQARDRQRGISLKQRQRDLAPKTLPWPGSLSRVISPISSARRRHSANQVPCHRSAG
jgi:hypothetical protein